MLDYQIAFSIHVSTVYIPQTKAWGFDRRSLNIVYDILWQNSNVFDRLTFGFPSTSRKLKHGDLTGSVKENTSIFNLFPINEPVLEFGL